MVTRPALVTINHGYRYLEDVQNGQLSAATSSPPQPLDRLRDDIAEGQEHGDPDEGGGPIGDLETPEGHGEDPGNERHERAQRPEETADEGFP